MHKTTRPLILSACLALTNCSSPGPTRPAQMPGAADQAPAASRWPDDVPRRDAVANPAPRAETAAPVFQAQPLPQESLPPEPMMVEPLPGYSTSPYGVDPIPEVPPTEPTSDEATLESAQTLPAEPQPYAVDLPPPESPALTPPPEPKVFNMSAPPAVMALQTDIEGNLKSGKYPDAAAALERAIRIQPKNAELWHVLADVRLKQQQPGLAEDLAKKSNLLAKGNAELIRSNWRLIAESRRQKGDMAGAADAMDRARQ